MPNVTIPSWNSPVVPELNGLQVDVTGNFTLVNVDPILGIVDFAGSGTVLATPAPVASPALGVLGMVLLVVGIAGCAAIALGRRRVSPRPTA